MANIKPFRAVRPSSYNVDHVASTFYDVPNLEEVEEITGNNPKSFLNIERAEAGLPKELQSDRLEVTQRAKENYDSFFREGWLTQDEIPSYYLYRIKRDDEIQYGIVMILSLEEYKNGTIDFGNKDFQDRFGMVDLIASYQAQTSPVLLSIPYNQELDGLLDEFRRSKFPSYSFDFENDTNHCVWIMNDENFINRVTTFFAEEVSEMKLLAGGHLIEAAAKVAEKRKAESPEDPPDASYNYVMAFVYPDVEELVTWPLSGLFVHEFESNAVNSLNQ